MILRQLIEDGEEIGELLFVHRPEHQRADRVGIEADSGRSHSAAPQIHPHNVHSRSRKRWRRCAASAQEVFEIFARMRVQPAHHRVELNAKVKALETAACRNPWLS